jgi:hypothetical protein
MPRSIEERPVERYCGARTGISHRRSRAAVPSHCRSIRGQERAVGSVTGPIEYQTDSAGMVPGRLDDDRAARRVPDEGQVAVNRQSREQPSALLLDVQAGSAGRGLTQRWQGHHDARAGQQGPGLNPFPGVETEPGDEHHDRARGRRQVAVHALRGDHGHVCRPGRRLTAAITAGRASARTVAKHPIGTGRQHPAQDTWVPPGLVVE